MARKMQLVPFSQYRKRKHNYLLSRNLIKSGWRLYLSDPGYTAVPAEMRQRTEDYLTREFRAQVNPKTKKRHRKYTKRLNRAYPTLLLAKARRELYLPYQR